MEYPELEPTLLSTVDHDTVGYPSFILDPDIKFYSSS